MLLRLVLVLSIPIGIVAQVGEVSGLQSALAEGPVDQSVVYAIEGLRPDQRIMPDLKAAFAEKPAKEEKQLIAATLLRLGEGSATYFDYLAGYAANAIDDRTPMFIRYDSKGQSVRGELNPSFENWCAQNGKDPRKMARLLASVYPADVRILAYAQDARAVDLFRRGLESSNVLVMAYSVQGLGRLNDKTAIPLIRKACDRLLAGEKLAVAMQLPWFPGADAEQLMRDLAPDPNMRDVLKRLVYQEQLIERNNALRRAGKAPVDVGAG